ncbi:sulfite exporter TauE/SafE family protein [Empedobacter tilapiae]
MIEFLTLNFFLILITFFIAGFVKGVAGMGLPTIAMGILSIIMSPLSAASLLIIPSFITNVWQLFTGPKFLDLIKRFWVMMIGIVIGTLAGSWFLTSINTPYSSIGLGLALILYSLHGLFGKTFSISSKFEPKLSPIIGLATGLLNGATGIFTLPAVPYIQALNLSKDDLIQALGLSFTVSTIALATGLVKGGVFQMDNILPSTIAIIPALLGMWVGSIVRKRISIKTFRICFFIFIAIIGAEITFHPFLS